MVDGYTSYDFLNKEERAKTLESVYALKDHWLHYGKGVFEDVPFYVLGTANYQEVEDGDITGYTKMYQEKNPVLKENFSWLYDRTKIFLEDIYKAPFDFYDNCGLPGFNIYLDDDFFEIAFATRHVDRQYLDIDWKGKEIDESKTLSFTCYLKLPANGGGMNVWNVKYDDVKDIEDPEERENVFDTRGYEFKEFKEGEIALHDGLGFHQVAPYDDFVDGDNRISYQGHAVWADDRYWIHW